MRDVGERQVVLLAAGELEGEGEVVEAEVAPPVLPAELGADDPDVGAVAEGVAGRGQGGGVGTGARDEDDVQGAVDTRSVGRLGIEEGDELGDPCGGDEEGPDGGRVPCRAVHPVRGNGLGQGEGRGREQGGVVEQAPQQRGVRRPAGVRSVARRRGHAPQATEAGRGVPAAAPALCILTTTRVGRHRAI